MRFGAYEVEATLGAGGAGTVYRARAAGGEPVAIKALRRRGEDSLRRFERELRLQAQLGAETGFVPVIETGVQSGTPFLVMPLLAGGTLRDRLRRGPLGVAETASLGVALARALGRAHALGIVHRDVKPENVLFDAPGGRAFIADLGLAKHFDDSAPGASGSVSLSTQGGLVGTAGYMAPEQAGGAKEVGPPADVFALGAVLYECLAGEPAFHGETVIEVLAAVCRSKPRPVARIRRDVPAGLLRAIEGALEPDPRARLADGRALAAALDAAPARRSRAGPALLLLVTAAVVVGAVALARALGAHAAAPPPPPPPPPRAAAARMAALERDVLDRLLRLDLVDGPARAAELVALAPGSAFARAAVAFFLRIEDPERAAAETDAALRLDPRCALAWATRARAVASPADALACAEKAIAADPRSPFGWTSRGYLRMEAGDLRGADEDETRAIELEPRFVTPHTFRARIRSRTGDLRGCLEDATRAIEIAPGIADAYLIRGDARNRTGDTAGALEDATRCFELDPHNTDALLLRGAVQTTTKRHEEAIADLSRVIRIEDRSGYAFLFRSTSRLALGQSELALSDAARAVELLGETPDAICSRGEARAALGERAEARLDLERSLRLDPGHAHAARATRWLRDNPEDPARPEAPLLPYEWYARQAEEAQGAGDRARLLRELARAVHAAPSRAAVWISRAITRSAAEPEAAAADAAQATDLEPSAGDVWSVRAVCELARGELDEALAAAERAVALAPEQSTSRAVRAKVRSARGEHRAAVADAAAAVAIDPHDADRLELLQSCLARAGDARGARAVDEHILATWPASPKAALARDRLAKSPR